MNEEWEEAARTILEGGVGVLPTDTLYALVGSALIPETIERIYDLKDRALDKPLIVLISTIESLEQFGVVLGEELKEQLQTYWPACAGGPGPTTIILPIVDDEFSYIHCGTGTIAFRIPDKANLIELINAVGPIVAPSANVEGAPPAKSVLEARAYFGTDAYFYIDEGELIGAPSRIISLESGVEKIIR